MSPAQSMGTWSARIGSMASSIKSVRFGHPGLQIAVSASATWHSAVSAGVSSRSQISRSFHTRSASASESRITTQRVQVREVSVGGAFGRAVEQPARPVHPALRDDEIAAGEPRQAEFDGLHRRRRRIGARQLPEDAFGDAQRLLAVAQLPGGRGHRVEVVGAQRVSSPARVKAVVRGMPIAADVRCSRRQQQVWMGVYAGIHVSEVQRYIRRERFIRPFGHEFIEDVMLSP